MGDVISFDVELNLALDAAIQRVTDELKKEGFGVLTRADIHTAFLEKLGKTFCPYVILGACNPPLAYQALSARPEAGLLLPCNVVVEESSPGRCTVRIGNPLEMMKSGGFDADAGLLEVGTDAYARLRRVAEALR